MKTSIGSPLGSGGTGQAGGGAKGSGGAVGSLATCVHAVTPQLLRRDLIGSHAELYADLYSGRSVDTQWTLSGRYSGRYSGHYKTWEFELLRNKSSRLLNRERFLFEIKDLHETSVFTSVHCSVHCSVH